MPTTPLLPLPDELEITSISESQDELLVRATSHRTSSLCPLCRTPSYAIHSYYRRKPLELPCAGKTIRLLLSVKKFFCHGESCPRKIFTERLPELLEPSSRLTTRLRSIVQLSTPKEVLAWERKWGFISPEGRFCIPCFFSQLHLWAK
jgi:transposase